MWGVQRAHRRRPGVEWWPDGAGSLQGSPGRSPAEGGGCVGMGRGQGRAHGRLGWPSCTEDHAPPRGHPSDRTRDSGSAGGGGCGVDLGPRSLPLCSSHSHVLGPFDFSPGQIGLSLAGFRVAPSRRLSLPLDRSWGPRRLAALPSAS